VIALVDELTERRFGWPVMIAAMFSHAWPVAITQVG